MELQREWFLPIHRVSLSEIDPSASDNWAWQNWVHKRIDLPKLIKEARKQANTEAFLKRILQQKVGHRNGRKGKER